MSNIRPIADPSLAAAMVATFQSIDDARSAPSGMSATRWRILKCIAKAAPNVPSAAELRLCSGLKAAALAENLRGLRWKGLVEMDGYRLSPSAADMVGIEHPYPPKDAKEVVVAKSDIVRDDKRCAWHDRWEEAHNRAFAVNTSPADTEKLRRAIAAMGVQDMPVVPLQPTIIGVDLSSRPDVAVEVTGRYREDGGIEIIKIDAPLTPADVPACMRPDCTAPEKPFPAPKKRRQTNTETNKHGRGGAAVARPPQGSTHRDRVAPDRAPRAMEEVAGSNPAPGQPAKPTISAPPAEPPKPTNWIERRHQRLAGAIAYLKSQAILVSVVDRDAPVRTYRASGRKYSLLAEEVVELAIEKGWSE